MGMNRSILKICFIFLWLNPALSVYSQDATFRLSPEKSKMTVSGTSTVHDWTCDVKELEGWLTLPPSMANKMPKRGDSVKKASISAAVKSIVSGRGLPMDKRTWEALKAEEFPKITFEATQSRVNKIIDLPAGTFEMTVKGDLTIAGVTRPVELILSGKKLSGGGFQFTGSKQLKMTTFNITPPTAMFGQIVAGDDVTVQFDLVYSKAQ